MQPTTSCHILLGQPPLGKSHSPEQRHGPKWCAAGCGAPLQSCYPVAGTLATAGPTLAAKSHLIRSLSTLVTHQEAGEVISPVISVQHGVAVTSNSPPVFPAGQGPTDPITQGDFSPCSVLYSPCCLPSTDPQYACYAQPILTSIPETLASQVYLHLDDKTLTWLILCPF